MEKPEQLPEQFGRYRIIKRLGQGGMGSVYLAEDTQLKRRVALKVPDFGPNERSETRQRFLEEARTAATLDHPYLCPVYDVGESDGHLYLTMAFIEGNSLAELTHGKSFTPRQVAALVGKLALAMQEAHARKVIHRDLKPANVMIKTTGQRREPVIVDFGLAHRDNPDEVRLTRNGQIMGTLSYMAPEQIRGDLKEIGPACDIYALGVILYELLTGRLPFIGSGLAVAGQILTVLPLPPSTHQSDLDPALDAICLKAMAKQVGDRYTSMGELAAALTDYLRSLSATPTSTSPAGPSGSPAPTSGEPLQPTGSNSLVGQLLDQLDENKASLPPIPTPEQTASPPPLPDRHRRSWPWIVATAVLGALLLGVIGYVATDKGRSKTVGFQDLFNGKDLSSWKTHPSQPGNWYIENGVLIGSGSPLSHLYTERDDFKDFHLRVKARINNHGNAGVCFRTRYDPANNQGFPSGFGAQISSSGRPFTGSLWMIPGGFFGRGGTQSPVPPDTWFTLEVIADDDRIIVKVDGNVTSEQYDAKRLFSSGRIALEQADPAAKVEFSSIEIKELNGTSGRD